MIKAMKQSTISRVMAEMGRRGGKAGGKKGGTSRMAALTPEERSELARKAARSRWAKVKGKAAAAAASGQQPSNPVPQETADSPSHLTPKPEAHQAPADRLRFELVVEATDRMNQSDSTPPVPSTETGRDTGPDAKPGGERSRSEVPVILVSQLPARAAEQPMEPGPPVAGEASPASAPAVEPLAWPASNTEHIIERLSDVFAHLEGGNQPLAESSLREALRFLRPLLETIPNTAPEREKLRQTLVFLDEVRMGLGQESGEARGAARSALKIWA